MVKIMINVALQRPKNTNTTNITMIKVIMIVSFKLSIVFKIFVEVSMITSSFTSEGKLACISGSFWCTFLAMFTEFAPDCFCMKRFLRTFLDTVLYTGHVTQIYVLSVLATDH